MTAVLKILQFGDPGLHVMAKEVMPQDGDIHLERTQMYATLAAFRAHHGWGRALAATQVGIAKRMLAIDLGNGPFLMINPVFSPQGAPTRLLWDDCFSLPSAAVRVRRFETGSVVYQDEVFAIRTMHDLPFSMAELIQHEIDHLDGIIMTDRMEGARPIISRDLKGIM